MTDGWPLLSLLVLVPLFGALLILLQRGDEERVGEASRGSAFLLTLITFILSLAAFFRFDPTLKAGHFQLVENIPLFPAIGLSYHLGVDGISMALILLTTLLMPIAILASSHVEKRVREYMVSFLLLESVMIGTFCALDTFLFYVFFEAGLIPMFLIIGIWGGPRRVYASFKFFLYTLLGSVLMLLALIVLYLKAGTTDMEVLLSGGKLIMGIDMQKWLWLAFLASFAVKLPMWPVHTWLPDAHVEAPTAGSIILAGILLKMGGYGFMRFSLPLLPDASAYFVPMMWGLAVIAIVYTSLVALVQEDMKKLIAYSSVAHMGFVTLGLFAFNMYGLQAAMFQMISHGVVSGALFLCVGVLYDRMHTRSIAAYGGVTNVMPKFAVLFMVMTLASVGLPGTSGFVGEFLGLVSTFMASRNPPFPECAATFGWSQTVAFIATTGVVLGAAYMLWLYRRVMYGEVGNAEVAGLKDVTLHELVALVVLAAVVIWLGIYANTVIEFLAPSLERLYGQMTMQPICRIAPMRLP